MPLLSYDDALTQLLSKVNPIRRTATISVERSSKRVLAKSIKSRLGNPRFTNSAVDGYAVGNSIDAAAGKVLTVFATTSAGEVPEETIENGYAIRVFTGAALPNNVYAVVMQENCERIDDKVRLLSGVSKDSGIRHKGEEFKEGALLLAKGKELNSGCQAILNWEGIKKVPVIDRPRISVISTGNELCKDEESGESQINDSNGPMLCDLVSKAGGYVVNSCVLPDDPAVIRQVLMEEATGQSRYWGNVIYVPTLRAGSDLIIVSGGMSVGDHDHIPALVAELGEVLFHGVRIKPGKPALAGRIGGAIIIGLPGNPASSFACFHLFAKPVINKLLGKVEQDLWFQATFNGTHSPEDREVFARCQMRFVDGQVLVTPIGEQGSFGLKSLADGDCLARLSAGKDYQKGDPCQISLLRS